MNRREAFTKLAWQAPAITLLLTPPAQAAAAHYAPEPEPETGCKARFWDCFTWGDFW